MDMLTKDTNGFVVQHGSRGYSTGNQDCVFLTCAA